MSSSERSVARDSDRIAAQVRELVGSNLVDEAGARLLETLSDSESLIDAGLLDSLGVVQLVALLEQRFQLVFDPLDVTIENLESIESITGLVGLRSAD